MIAPYKLKMVSSPEDIQKFIAGYDHAYSSKKIKNKHSLKVETLLKYDYVFGVFRKEKLIAGFIVNLYPQRCFEDFNPQQHEQSLAKLGVSDSSEVVAIWKSQELSRFILWYFVTLGTLIYGRKYIFGCAYKGHGMTKNYYLLSPEVVRAGRREDDLEVFYYTRSQFLGSFVFGVVNTVFIQPVRNAWSFLGQFFGQRDTNITE